MRRSSHLAISGAAAVVLVGSFLPWVRVGARDRSSYALTELLDRLEFAPDGVASWSLTLWPLLPLLLVAAVVGVWTGWRRVGGSLGVLAALYAAGLATAVLLAPTTSRPGAPLALFGAALLLPSSVFHVWSRPHAGRAPATKRVVSRA
ncbi:MAG: hypothetical protein R2705_21465 [Ilumatobacteraceae bacterium]